MNWPTAPPKSAGAPSGRGLMVRAGSLLVTVCCTISGDGKGKRDRLPLVSTTSTTSCVAAGNPVAARRGDVAAGLVDEPDARLAAVVDSNCSGWPQSSTVSGAGVQTTGPGGRGRKRCGDVEGVGDGENLARPELAGGGGEAAF